MNQIVQEFSDIIRARFEERFRRDGVTPYFNHLEGVRRNTVLIYGHNELIEIVSLGHDALEKEDDGFAAFSEDGLYVIILNILTRYYETHKKPYTLYSAEAQARHLVDEIIALTKEDGETYPEYIARLKKICGTNQWKKARLMAVKASDFLENSLDPDSTDKQRAKYRAALSQLRGDN